ncbi:BTAD domain-containing putative transcriptional regulator [Streptomyces sp. NPDC001941]|uniref:AfsR/SARP family transcriptional regulator n=1 Tax=Streptomyces sp. NPDC001941 TaxID=3154659 RepID=UPI0033176506
MEFRLLGGVAVGAGGGELPLGPAKRRSVLAVLLLRCNTAVPMPQLLDAVWEDSPPAHARTIVQGHVSQLRMLLAEARAQDHAVRIATHGSAYVLETPELLLDVHRFEELVARGGQEPRPEAAAPLLREALGLWRGPALTGTVPSAVLGAAAQALEEARLSTVERLAELQGRLGDFAQAVALLKTEAAAHPLRESLTTALMVTLYQAGHQSDALDWYHRTRGLLDDELGVSPGPAMRATYEGILRGDLLGERTSAAMPRGLSVESSGAQPSNSAAPGMRPARIAAGAVRDHGASDGAAGSPGDGGRPTAAPRASVAVAPGSSPGPSHAYSGIPGAAGAPPEPDLHAPVAPSGDGGPRQVPPSPPSPAPGSAEQPSGTSTALPVPRLLPRAARGFHGRRRELAALDSAAQGGAVALLTGAAGVGKTALALHWAHQRQRRFPDGVLFADLRGFGDDPVEPDELVREFLLAFGVKPRDLPETAMGAAALYRELTSRRALLVILDNAHSADQVRPLLPDGDHATTVVTSRLRLTGLIVGELARPVPLDVLGRDDSVDLLASAVGGERVAAEPEAAARLGALCDGLPLALRITAAQIATRPGWKLSDLAAELADEQRRLSLLSLTDSEDAGVAAALRLTVQGLPAESARLFALLGTLPGPDLDRAAAAALADRDPVAAGAALDRLTGAHLLTEHAPGRYSLHDLVRLYARGLPSDSAALPRLLDSYVTTALAAASASAPDDKPCCTLPDGAYTVGSVRKFTDRQDSLRWYATERENLAAAVLAARAAGHDDRAWRLVVLQWPYITWNVRDGWTPLLEEALAAAVALDDPDAETRVRALLGWVLLEEDRLAEAMPHLELAPGLAARAGDASSEATALVNLALALERKGDLDQAVARMSRATELAHAGGDLLTELLALELKARLHLATGAMADAVGCTAYALTVLADRPGLPAMRHVMLRLTRAQALGALGEHEEASACAARALADAQRLGYKEGVARARELEQRMRLGAGA